MSETETEIATEFGTADYIIIAVALSVIVAVYFLLTKKKAPAKSNILTPPGTTTTKPQQQKPSQEAVEEKGIPMTILYGSQSGTAETFSYELAKEAKSHGFAATVIDLEKYDHENKLPNEKFVCFLLATFGEGEPTDSSQKFYEWMMSPDRVPGTVEGVEYACFALGNRQYEHFCAVGRRITNKMKELGAIELLDHGEGDDDGSLEDDYAAWKKKFWEVAQKRFGGDSHEVESKFEGSFNITYHEDEKTHGVAPFANSTNEDDDFVLVDTPSRVPAVVMDPKHGGDFAPVTDNYELRQDSTGGSTRHIEIDLSSMPFSYRTADTLGVYPRNNFKLAAKMAKRLGVNTKTAFSLTSKVGDRKLPFPSPCTVHDALLWYCDLTSIPKRGLLETLATYATDAADKAKLMNWIHEGKAQYHEDQKNLVEVMQEVPSVKPPLEHFLEFVPKLVPRLYTISSSSRVSPSRLTITVSVTKADKPRGRVHEGVCSTYLASLVPNKDKVAVFVRASTFRPAWDPVIAHPAEAGRKNSEEAPQRLRKVSISELKEGIPMIMIGPGTGVAPFRGFLQEAEFLRKQGVKLGDLYLYFGCQRSDRDFIYKEEFEGFEKSGVAKVSLAFSREGNQKVYVQHRMAEHAQQIWDLLENKGAHMYLCGGTSMGRDVRNAVIDIAKKYGGRSDADAQKYLATLQDTGRFIQELWS